MCTEEDASKAAAEQYDRELQSLLERCAISDSDALHRLYDLVSPALYACITQILHRRSLAEEALQDVFINIWQRAAQFDATRGRAKSWMMTIARNRAIDILRRERATSELIEEPAAQDSAPSWLPSNDVLRHCLDLLTGQQRQVIELAFISGASHQDIALVTGSPLGTVKSRIRRGLRSLRNCLEAGK
jgi:RNA polymerase sigma-70 factor (ECF subfamily)